MTENSVKVVAVTVAGKFAPVPEGYRFLKWEWIDNQLTPVLTPESDENQS